MNNISLFCFLASFLLFPFCLLAQHELEANFYSDNFSNPGISTAYSYAFKTRLKEKLNKVVQKQLSAGLKVSWYSRQNHHTALIPSCFIRYQATYKSGFLIQPELGLGYMYKKNKLPTFEYSNSTIQEVENAVHHRFYPSLSLGVGYRLAHKYHFPIQFYFRPGLSIETPNNLGSLIHFQSEIGISYLLGGGGKRRSTIN
jgi:hypothetical protein